MHLPLKRFWQLGLLILVVVAVSTILLNLTYLDLQEQSARNQMQTQARSQSKFIQLLAQNDSLPLTAPHWQTFFSQWNRLSDSSGLKIWALINRSTGETFPIEKRLQKSTYDSLVQHGLLDGEIHMLPKQKLWIKAEPILAQNGDRYLIFARPAFSKKWFSRPFWMIFTPFIVTIALLLLVILLVVYHSFKQPLKSMRHLAEHLNAGDYDYRIEYSRNDEFTDTFMRINHSLERLGVGEESYSKKEENIRNLLEVLEESIVVVNEHLQLATYNPAVVKLFGCAQGEQFPELFARVVDENIALRDLIRQLKALGQESLTRSLVLWVDEKELQVNVTVQRLDNQRLLLMFKDLSRVRELQNNLLRSMKFGIIANLVSSISHEIRNPLSAVGIHAEILSNRLTKQYPELDEKLKKSLTIIQNEIKRINRIHTQFFNLARKRELKLAEIKPNSILEDVVQLVQHHALEQQIALHIELDHSIDFIYGDVDQLKQVFLNIVLNAFQAVDQDGEVQIKTSQDAQKVYVEITDNGQGIPPEVGEHIFDLYFTTKKDGGGIGLALCKKIVEAHEGQIWFRSKVGQGTTFIVAFPRITRSKKERIQTRLTELRGK